MKFLKIFLIIFISINTSLKADSKNNLIQNLKQGGKLIFIRHAYAPGGGDPENFNLDDCTTQRNLSKSGQIQAMKIGNFFIENQIEIKKIYSSEWCRCKETASIAFQNFEKFLKNWDQKKNLIFVTHYVVISEILDYAPASGEIVISNKDLKIVDTLEIEY